MRFSPFAGSLLAAGIILSATAAYAAEAETTINLKDAAARALAQNRQVSAQALQTDAARYQAKAATGHLMPSVDAAVRATRTNNPLNVFGTKLLQQSVTAADFNPATLNNPAAITNYQSEITLRMPIYQGGELWAGRKLASAKADEAEWQLTGARQETLFQLITAYTQVLEYQALVESSRKAVESAESHVANVRKLFGQGILIRSDTMDAEAHLLQTRVQLQQAENGLAYASDQFNRILGANPDESLTPDDQAALHIDNKGVEQWIETADSNRPELKAMQARIDAADANTDRQRAGFLPKVGVMASEQWNNSNLAPRHNNYTVGMEVSVNLFSGGSDHAEYQAAKAELAGNELLLADMRQQVRNQVFQAWRQLHEAEERSAAQQQILTQAEESLRILTLREKQGLERAADVLSAQSQTDSKRAMSIQASYDVIRRQAALLRAAGVLAMEDIQ